MSRLRLPRSRLRTARAGVIRRNLVRNAAATGAVVGVVGSGGALPTFWTGSTFGFEVLGTGVEDSLPFIDLRVTAGGALASTLALSFDSAGAAPLVGSAAYTASIYARLVGGSFAGFTVASVRRRTDLASPMNGANVSILGATGASLSSQRVQGAGAVAADAVSGRMVMSLTTTGPASVDLRLAVPQLELGSTATAPQW